MNDPNQAPARPSEGAVLSMILPCPRCRELHVDAPEPEKGWTNPPHKSHLCHYCGLVWRPADVPTNGVAAIATIGKDDNWKPGAADPRPAAGEDRADGSLGAVEGELRDMRDRAERAEAELATCQESNRRFRDYRVEMEKRAEQAEVRVAELEQEVGRLTDEMIEDSAAHVSVVARVAELEARSKPTSTLSTQERIDRAMANKSVDAVMAGDLGPCPFGIGKERPAPRREGQVTAGEDVHAMMRDGAKLAKRSDVRRRGELGEQPAQQAGGDSEVERVAKAIREAADVKRASGGATIWEDMARAAIAAMARTGRGVGEG